MPKRYIDADALIGRMHFVQFEDGEDRSLVYALIDMQPTADVQEVVRCRDCKHYDPEQCYCNVWGDMFVHWEECDPVDPDGFCNRGERDV